jgi:hypothetical protein
MEQVLDVYKRPYNEENPVVCMDESPEQLIEIKEKTEIKPGREAREDYEYIRHGVANVFMANEPLKGKRFVEVTDSKTKVDRAKFMAKMANEKYPDAKKITLVTDNYPMIDRFEFVFTPKHGSWLNRAGIELHILNRQCLDRKIATIEKMKSETEAWQPTRNAKEAKINRQFTNKEARVKLRRLYPSIYN